MTPITYAGARLQRLMAQRLNPSRNRNFQPRRYSSPIWSDRWFT